MADAFGNLLIAGTASAEIESLLPFARALAGEARRRFIVVGLVQVPQHASLSTGALKARRLRRAIEPSAQKSGGRVIARVAHNIWRELQKTITAEECRLLLLNWHNPPPKDWMRHLPCDLALVKPPFPATGAKKILLPVRGGPYAALALRLALAIAEFEKGEITVLHAMPPERQNLPSNRELLARLNAMDQVTNWTTTTEDVVSAIFDAASTHHLVVMGSIANPHPDDPPIGPTATRVLNQSDLPVLVVKSPPPVNEAHTGIAREPVDYTISVIVDKWFAENTFHASEFKHLKRLIELKEEQALTISLGLPALNEEKTIGKIVRTIRQQLITRYPLLDEIVVIDSDSTDRTVEIVQRLGVPVFRHPEILSMYGTYTGKGEALWKSLQVLKGDLVAWIDTDIGNIHPRFVYGILGPLILEPHLMYIKGFYQRPLRVGGHLEARGGGRVTELVARPLFNLFYPELSGLIQPLAGEYAGRRSALESMPFIVGYGVETGLLIDVYKQFGLRAIGQVDLEQRVHRNQSLLALSKMAFEIIQVVLQRVGSASSIELVNELNKSMKLVRYARDEFMLDVADIRVHERPPIITLPEYRARHERSG